MGKVIQLGRQEKGMTQKDLATKINEKPQVIADYECGRAIPNNQVMGKIERVIGLKLRGKDIGQPLEAKSKKKWTQSLEISPTPPNPTPPLRTL